MEGWDPDFTEHEEPYYFEMTGLVGNRPDTIGRSLIVLCLSSKSILPRSIVIFTEIYYCRELPIMKQEKINSTLVLIKYHH
jgi:hypothetical protein